jgi:hypothetical protein
MERSRVGPNPVSCRSCRTKKLKCSRVQPCTNCTARGISCHFLVPPQPQTVAISTATNSNAELLGRIERLEAIIKRPHSAETHPEYASDDSHLTKRLKHATTFGAGILSDIHQIRDEDLHLLQNIGTREDSLVCVTSFVSP